MAHHKKKRAKNQRAGCRFCKPYKGNGVRRRGNVGSSNRSRTWKQEWRGWLKEREGRRGE